MIRLGRRPGVAIVAALLGTGAPSAARAADDGPLELAAPGAVGGLRVLDMDGDGVKDLAIVSGRDVLVWRAGKGRPIPKAPTETFRVPDSATYVAPWRPLGTGAQAKPSLLALGTGGALRLVAGVGAQVEEGLDIALPFTDRDRAVLADFAQGTSLFLPTPDGVRWIPDAAGARGTSLLLPLPPKRVVAAAGPFVEDGATVRVSWPAPVLVPSWPAAKGAPAVFCVGTEAIHAFARRSDGSLDAYGWSTAFLAGDGDRRGILGDLDADGTPDLVHVVTTNDSGAYVAFRTPPPSGDPGAREVTDLRPGRGSIRLKGFQLPLETPDLDGDGRPDLVVTSIDIDGSNVMRAVMQGRVVAKTRAFRNRSAAGGDWFSPNPDATIESEIGVRIYFTYSGAIEVKRSFTILAAGDLDGDGRKDLAIRTGLERLSIYQGAKDGIWSKTPVEIAIPAVGRSPDVEGYTGDLDGDGKDDLVLLYRAPPGGADRTIVVRGR
jgi:hypothetical protein